MEINAERGSKNGLEFYSDILRQISGVFIYDPLQKKLSDMEYKRPSITKIKFNFKDRLYFLKRNIENIVEQKTLKGSSYQNFEDKLKDILMEREYLLGNGNSQEFMPQKTISRKENHGCGYHFHVEYKGKRAGILLTIKDGNVYAQEHGNSGRVNFDFRKNRSSLIRALEKPDILKQMKKEIEWVQPSKKAEYICGLYNKK